MAHMLHKLEFGSKGNLILIFLAKPKSLQLCWAARRNMLHKNHVLLQLTDGQVRRAAAFTSALHWTCSPTGSAVLTKRGRDSPEVGRYHQAKVQQLMKLTLQTAQK